MAPNKPTTWTATHRIRCPYCQKLFESTFRSDQSQQHADDRAEDTVWSILDAHIKRDHPKEAR